MVSGGQRRSREGGKKEPSCMLCALGSPQLRLRSPTIPFSLVPGTPRPWWMKSPKGKLEPRMAAWNQGTPLDSYQFLYLATELFVC